jgi:hypothetical protein
MEPKLRFGYYFPSYVNDVRKTCGTHGKLVASLWGSRLQISSFPTSQKPQTRFSSSLGTSPALGPRLHPRRSCAPGGASQGNRRHQLA